MRASVRQNRFSFCRPQKKALIRYGTNEVNQKYAEEFSFNEMLRLEMRIAVGWSRVIGPTAREEERDAPTGHKKDYEELSVTFDRDGCALRISRRPRARFGTDACRLATPAEFRCR